MTTTPTIACLERDSIDAPFRAPATAHRWVEYPHSAPDEVVARLQGADIAIVNKLRLGAAQIAALPALRMVAVSATGADNVDLAACSAQGIVVSNVRGYAVDTVPEHAMTLILALRRRLLDYVADVRAGRWERSENFCFFDHPIADLAGSTLGVVGYGDLGRGVARLCEAFGMRVLRAEQRGAAQVREGYTAFEQVLAEADVLSLNCPLNASTRGLIGAAELARMKPSAILVNTSRGGLVDEAALAAALRVGRIAGAATDVLSSEPPREGNALLVPDIPNLIVTPHVAWASAQAMQRLADQVIDNIDAFLAGAPRNRLA
ncbi:D-2-hydroxyacid dehydrogenase [Pseudothauera nasutitermitis]|uniref:D-2-hydroxyacid dehydrogenase n=1 Tax=Pseudothauera nasutitermitis TaxID=2565930 RepID=A0A4S4ATI0_9RHOO|nr:D-2-hydroxyacid dehydrogenase [Pseudothauera nasutitermitis]THF63174.1 D-2-hydroxyacid dehydrogenase [Pseudothauera nasutitermitis]